MPALHRFNDAVEAAAKWISEHRESLGDGIVLLRDQLGRLHVALPRERVSMDEEEEHRLDASFREAIGAFTPPSGSVFVFRDSELAISVFRSEDSHPLEIPSVRDAKLVDHQLLGQDWTRLPLQREDICKRATFYGMKGGVGRSTALTILALRLASESKNVLVVDLDLESPGLSSLLLPPAKLPEFGLVDWFVEDGVGQADERLIKQMLASSPLSARAPGKITIAPAYGNGETNYIAKLARAYAPVQHGTNIENFAQRIGRLLGVLESADRPDIVLIDSRAGLHDIAAVTVTRLGATVFLFATNSAQTWSAYNLLFQHWRRYPHILARFRENLKLVDALVPETDRAKHLKEILQASNKLFSETIYEEAAAGELDVFNFDPSDSEAPHYPLRITWSRRFQEFDPISEPDLLSTTEIDAAFGDFIRGARILLDV